MSDLKITQRHVDGVAKQFEGILANINAGIAKAAELLTPGNAESFSGAQATAQTCGTAAQLLWNASEQLASLAATKQWQSIIEKQMNDEDESKRTMNTVSIILRNLLVANANGLENSLHEGGRCAFRFRTDYIELVANVIAMNDMVVASHEQTEALCAEQGLDYAKVRDGDKDEVAKLIAVLEKINGGPLAPRMYEAVGLPVPEAAQPHVGTGNPASDAAIAEALGLDGGSANAIFGGGAEERR